MLLTITTMPTLRTRMANMMTMKTSLVIIHSQRLTSAAEQLHELSPHKLVEPGLEQLKGLVSCLNRPRRTKSR